MGGCGTTCRRSVVCTCRSRCEKGALAVLRPPSELPVSSLGGKPQRRPSECHRLQENVSSPAAATRMVGLGDAPRDGGRHASREESSGDTDRATWMAMVVAWDREPRRQPQRRRPSCLALLDDKSRRVGDRGSKRRRQASRCMPPMLGRVGDTYRVVCQATHYGDCVAASAILCCHGIQLIGNVQHACAVLAGALADP
jgi:hypothetical protein